MQLRAIVKTAPPAQHITGQSRVKKKWNTLEITILVLATAILVVVLCSPGAVMDLVANLTSSMPLKVISFK
jgi:hypothetical protein